MKTTMKQLPIVTVAIAILGVSINMFLAPHHIAAGGVSGIGILAEEALGIDRAIVVLVLNLVMLLLTFFFLGKTIFIRTVIGSMLLPLSLAVVPEIMVTQDRLLSVIFGSALFAVGVAILYKIGASSGGTTIPPLIFKKYFDLNTSVGLLCTDAIIVLFNIFVFGVEEFLYAILSIVITSVVMNYIETGLKRRKAIMIMSETHIEAIKSVLQANSNRGITVFSVSGGYTGTEKNMLMIVMENQEYPGLLKLINEVDSKAFVIAYNVSEVHGLEFTYQPLG
ncbi:MULTISPECIES: YitT family protein [Carnobacterium]|uniref:YitT family protein n=1 Tax=Carnobacterium TaxID=2747 RepID=UPI002891770C|nr:MULTISPECIES: YitT family protein [Carnobacterium]MDT1938467.1 YitT family protein [Carnobacterium divergens]MDT1940905.1 YitT family protein [Carnobacterium divergens]MDT1946703.1 YitT family protein [Carnobacterium divergens]MDT1949139.1 YitT family protein [Carnobacterium divergens]MDT1954317.1 YitT family protein [Carnobacterium divergens]